MDTISRMIRFLFKYLFVAIPSFIALLFAILSIGCSQDPFSSDRPPVEPNRTDRPDVNAVASISRNHIASTTANPSVTADWPALFGSDRTSTSEHRFPHLWSADGPKLAWEVVAGTGYGSPVTASNRVVFNYRSGDTEVVQCHHVTDGELIWQHRYPTTAVCDFKYSNGPYSTPVIDADHHRVFNIGGEGQFSCLNFDTGKVNWVRNLHTEYGVQADIFPVGASPLLDQETQRPGGQLIFNLGAIDRDAGIISLDPATGETIWEASDQGPSYGTPFVATIHSQRFAFVLTDQGLVSLNPDSGDMDWFVEFRRKGDLVRNATSPLVIGNKVLVVSSGLGAICLEVQPDRSYTQLWRQRRTLDSQYNTLILADQHVYSFTSSRQGGAEFRCIEVEKGEMKWTYPSVLKRGMGLASPDAILLLGERGHLASLALNPDAPQVLSFTEKPLMSEPCYCSPAIYGDYLILKDEQRVAAFCLAE